MEGSKQVNSTLSWLTTHPRLGTDVALRINPDVLGRDEALLLEVEILAKLRNGCLLMQTPEIVAAAKETGLTVSVLETKTSLSAFNIVSSQSTRFIPRHEHRHDVEPSS